MRYLILAILDFGNTHKANIRKEYNARSLSRMNTSIDTFFFFAGAKRLDKISIHIIRVSTQDILNLLSTKEKKGKKEKRKRK